MFTKITVGVAIAWILLSMLMVILTNRRNSSAWGNDAQTSLTKELDALSSKSKGKDRSKQPGDASTAPTSPAATESQLPLELPAIPEVPVPA